MLRDELGKFKKGNEGFWLGKKRTSMTGNKNWRWSGGLFKKKCLICKKVYFVPKNRLIKTKFCSQSCLGKWKFTGARNPLWKGGILREKREELLEYRKWREGVYKKDWYQCKICKYQGNLIIAHHIKVWKYFPKSRFEVNNGLTLCRGCHVKLHTIHKKVIDFKEILRDFMSEMQYKALR